MRISRRERDGFALLAVLWVIVGLASFAFASSLATRNAIASSHNRSDMLHATWRANDCVERARAAIGEALLATERIDARAQLGWPYLDAVVRTSAIVAGVPCHVHLEAVGSRIDVNHADAEMLDALLRRLRIDEPIRDSMVDALLDWRDPDDIARPHGAERVWYAARGRLVPRNGAFADVREITRVRGFEKMLGLDSVFTVETGRVSLADAPLDVIAALPGMSYEVVARIAEERARGARVEDMTGLAGSLSPGARERMLARYSDLVHAATVETDAWILEARADAGAPAVTVIVELRLVRAGDRAAVVRRRTWVS
jgi:general secretion pathway protein K